ncbi:MAG: hypothetical protein KIS96_11385 [Bauldia sp.]|nr:hypothetical protein [Bauldia sp.]MCW5697318.1 hypothetical protein [Bauldia sp.]
MAGEQAAFWVVWNPSGWNPTVRHETFTAADQEARRLAAANPRHSFFVLRAVSVSTLRDPVDTTLLLVPDDGLPF